MWFKNIHGKLGNMRKSVEWVICPGNDNNEITIQSDKRIAKINRTTKKAILSSGKNGHNGFMHLLPILGATEVDVPQEFIDELEKVINNKPIPNTVTLSELI